MAALALVLGAWAEAPAWGRTFAEILGTPFTRPISDALARSVARSLPLISASAGFVFNERQDGSVRPLFGIRGTRPDIYDFSLGGRVNLWRDTLIAFANVIVPLNDDGVRSLVIPTAGVELTF